METRRNEESDFTTVAPAEMPGAPAEIAAGEADPTEAADDGGETPLPQGEGSADGTRPDTGGATDSTDSETSADSTGDSGGGGSDGAPDGTGAGEPGDDDGTDKPDPDDGDQSGAGGDDQPDRPEEPQPDQKDNPDSEGGTRFAERFLTSGGVPLSPELLLERRGDLAVILLGLAMELLTGRLPADRFIPLMDAAKAYEAIKAARTEGEIAGRNAVIEEQLVAPPVGAPDLGGTPIARSRRSATSIFDLADMAR